jgi:hypothetical protein
MPLPSRYSAFGMEISSDLSFPELPDSPAVSESSVWIQAGDREQWPKIAPSPHSTPTLQIAPGEWRLELEGIGWFRAADGERLEWQRWDDSVSDRDLRTFLVSSGLGALAIQRGALVLHGTALERGGEAVLLLGHPATGKSTLAWCLLEQGWRLLCSELVVINGLGQVLPGLQQLKIWHDTAVMLEIAWHQLPPVRRGLKRYALLPPDLACCKHSVPLCCIYGLWRVSEGSEGDGQPAPADVVASSSLGQQEALLSLRNHAFHPRVYRGMGAESQLFLQAAALARGTPMHWLRVPDGVETMRAALAQVDLRDPGSLQLPSDTSQGGGIDG